LSNGGIVSLVASAHSPGAGDDETIEIDGTAGRIDLPDPFGTAHIRHYRMADASWQEVPTDHTDSHQLMLAGFVEAVRNNGPVPAAATDAAAALAAVQAIYRSDAEGRSVDIEATA
jgi:predicted dehydrogenase